jgi:hypothetical protein
MVGCLGCVETSSKNGPKHFILMLLLGLVGFALWRKETADLG